MSDRDGPLARRYSDWRGIVVFAIFAVAVVVAVAVLTSHSSC